MPFRYLRDPLFLTCLFLYLANRWLFKPLMPGSFFQNYLNDFICIPFWMPILLWFLRKTGLRADDAPPCWHEILIPLLLWAWTFEILLPSHPTFQSRAVADAADIFFYVLGALLASLFWKSVYGKRPLLSGAKGCK